jgi:hypothetical protein
MRLTVPAGAFAVDELVAVAERAVAAAAGELGDPAPRAIGPVEAQVRVPVQTTSATAEAIGDAVREGIEAAR